MHQGLSGTTGNFTAIRRVDLAGGKQLLIDEEDAYLLASGKLKLVSFPHTSSVVVLVGGERLSRLIMNAPAGREVDHENGDTLDNRRKNLRLATRSQNACNRKGWGKSGYKGVCFHARLQKFAAYICKNKKQRSLGYFATAEDAARAYNDAARVLHGAFARFNIISQTTEG